MADGRKSLVSAIRFRRLPPPPDLAGILESIVEREDAAALGVALDFPDARPLLQIVLGADCLVRSRGIASFSAVPRAGLWGPSGGMHEVKVNGPMHILCGVLTLRGAGQLAGTHVSSFIDRRVDLAELGLDSAGLNVRLASATGFEQRADILADWLRISLKSGREPKTRPEFEAMASGELCGTVSKIARELGVTTRGLHKRCKHEIGWSPSKLLRIVRLQSSLRMTHPNPWSPELAEDLLLQFHDRAHFSKEFQSLTGMTPGTYRRAKESSKDCLVNTLYIGAAPMS